MLYLGGKGRNGRAIADVILARTEKRGRLIEPFIGGASVTKFLAPEFQDVLVGDIHEDLILMWKAAARGWGPPSRVSEEEYAAARKSPPSALRGFIGFGCSYGGKWWGGYARNKVSGSGERAHPDYYARLASRDVQEVGRTLANATIVARPYDEWDVTAATVIYADPPYAGTTRYCCGAFDSQRFWQIANLWSDAGAAVFVSEYRAPVGWTPIWTKSQPRKVSGGSGDMTTERLFIRAGDSR